MYVFLHSIVGAVSVLGAKTLSRVSQTGLTAIRFIWDYRLSDCISNITITFKTGMTHCVIFFYPILIEESTFSIRMKYTMEKLWPCAKLYRTTSKHLAPVVRKPIIADTRLNVFRLASTFMCILTCRHFNFFLPPILFLACSRVALNNRFDWFNLSLIVGWLIKG